MDRPHCRLQASLILLRIYVFGGNQHFYFAIFSHFFDDRDRARNAKCTFSAGKLLQTRIIDLCTESNKSYRESLGQATDQHLEIWLYIVSL